MNKRKTKSGQGAVVIKKYKYADNLNFLLPHIQDRNTITSIESENEETQNETEDFQSAPTPDKTINTDEQQQQEERSPVIRESNFTPSPDSNPNPPSTAQFTRSNNRNATVATHNNRRRIVPQSQPSASSSLMEYILKNKESKTQDIHPIDAFFNGMAATIKSFSPYYQHLAKGKIFAVVQDLEWEQLSAEPSCYTSPMSGTSANSTPVHAPVPMTTPTPTLESTPSEPAPSESTPSEPMSTMPNANTYFSQFTEDYITQL